MNPTSAAAVRMNGSGVSPRTILSIPSYKASMEFLIENCGEHPEPEPEQRDDYVVWDEDPYDRG